LRNRVLLICSILVFVLQAGSTPNPYIAFTAAGWSGGGVPSGWQIKVKDGKPDFSACPGQDPPCLHLRSVRSSFALERAVDVDPSELPYLTWNWKVAQLPPHGDFRRASTDDQAAQLLVYFDDRRIISYIWDSNAPQGVLQSASTVPLVHVYALVCRSGTGEINRWVFENQNVAADYERAYRRPAPRVKGLRIQINSQHTGAVAESYFGDVAFRSTPAK
jgi:hypothetical protein